MCCSQYTAYASGLSLEKITTYSLGQASFVSVLGRIILFHSVKNQAQERNESDGLGQKESNEIKKSPHVKNGVKNRVLVSLAYSTQTSVLNDIKRK